MKQISLGGLDVSRIGLGAMSVSGYYNFVPATCIRLNASC